MKHLLFIAASVLLASCAVQVFAAVQPTPGAKTSVKPVFTHTPDVQFRLRLMNQTKLITIGVSKGKITKQQEKDLRASLKNIHQQEMSFRKANANHLLTADQASQLNALLDKNSQALGETPPSN